MEPRPSPSWLKYELTSRPRLAARLTRVYLESTLSSSALDRRVHHRRPSFSHSAQLLSGQPDVGHGDAQGTHHRAPGGRHRLYLRVRLAARSTSSFTTTWSAISRPRRSSSAPTSRRFSMLASSSPRRRKPSRLHLDRRDGDKDRARRRGTCASPATPRRGRSRARRRCPPAAPSSGCRRAGRCRRTRSTRRSRRRLTRAMNCSRVAKT